MTQQDDITQRELTAEHHLNELMRLTQPWPNATIPCATVRSHVEQALSQVRAPVADERAAHGYGSPADVSQRIEQYLAQDGRMNSGTQLLYEAMKALRSLAKESK
ncbi:hypothetical protein NAT65_25820 [Achromobacter xylosoxidans]|uniref:hypothetical protein n=1 Tax=Alcaligenes xylosoxydans xylosoxydans TaxID=85698 RepID=UPI00203D9C99|nr:hypothetical protein [Achromobacter xylosoxidans]MCM2574519.1 hypothetical protein [Achromobacter xylosoxidans]WPQ34331.1 hypothetical protein SLH34_27575 [Achromobacter xylosoxidans]